jgi:hypothetical protein
VNGSFQYVPFKLDGIHGAILNLLELANVLANLASADILSTPAVSIA